MTGDQRGLAESERVLLEAWWNSRWPDDGSDVLDLLAGVLDRIIAARLADPAVVEAVARALVLLTEDGCDGHIPLTAIDVDTLAVSRRDDAAAAVAAVAGVLGGGE